LEVEQPGALGLGRARAPQLEAGAKGRWAMVLEAVPLREGVVAVTHLEA